MMRKFSGAAIALAFLTAFSIRVSAQSAIVKDFKEGFIPKETASVKRATKKVEKKSEKVRTKKSK